MEIEKFNHCIKCGHKWKQRGKRLPDVCPSCKSRFWNKISNDDIMDLIFKKHK